MVPCPGYIYFIQSRFKPLMETGIRLFSSFFFHFQFLQADSSHNLNPGMAIRSPRSLKSTICYPHDLGTLPYYYYYTHTLRPHTRKVGTRFSSSMDYVELHIHYLDSLFHFWIEIYLFKCCAPDSYQFPDAHVTATPTPLCPLCAMCG
jgi:hypothetical protein